MADDELSPADRIEEINVLLAEWAARSASDSEMLIQRLEGMGYDVVGKSEHEIAEVLKRPPTKPRRAE